MTREFGILAIILGIFGIGSAIGQEERLNSRGGNAKLMVPGPDSAAPKDIPPPPRPDEPDDTDDSSSL